MMRERRGLIVFAGALVTSTAAARFQPTEHLARALGPIGLDSTIPLSFSVGRVDANTPATIVNPQLEAGIQRIYSDVLTRTYVANDGYRIMLSVAYGGDQTDAVAAHRPEGCYRGQGFIIDGLQVAELETPYGMIPIKRMIARFGSSRIERVMYWLTVGETAVNDRFGKKLAEIRYTFHGVIPDGLIFRVSSIDDNFARADQRHQQFVLDLLHVVSPNKLSRLAGLKQPIHS